MSNKYGWSAKKRKTPADQPPRADEPEKSAFTVATRDAAFPNYTDAPGTRIPDYTSVADATWAPEIGQSEEVQGDFAETPSALVDKYLFSQFRKESIVLLVPLVPIIWIFLQDNGAGRLQTRDGVISCLTKCGIVLLLCCGIPLALAVVGRLLRRRA